MATKGFKFLVAGTIHDHRSSDVFLAGFAAAARSLNVSQPGISRAIARLEAAGWNPTPGADDTLCLPHGRRQAFYETIGPIVSALEAATSDLAEGKVTV